MEGPTRIAPLQPLRVGHDGMDAPAVEPMAGQFKRRHRVPDPGHVIDDQPCSRSQHRASAAPAG